MPYCAHGLRARPSERVREDGRAGIEQAGAHADGPDRAFGVDGCQAAAPALRSEVRKDADQRGPTDVELERNRDRSPAGCVGGPASE